MAGTPRLPSAFVRLIPQRGKADCSIAALASFTGADYEEVLIAASRTRKTIWTEGLQGPAHVRICKQLGVKARWYKKFDIDEDTGVLWVAYNDDASKHHDVLLIDGKIYDPDHNPVIVADHDDYFRHFNAYPKELLKRIGE